MPFTSPASVIATRPSGSSVSAEQPDGVMIMPSRVRGLTLPALPTIRPRRSDLAIDRRDVFACLGVRHIRNTPLPSACLSNSL